MHDSRMVDYIFDRIGRGAWLSELQDMSMANVYDGCPSEAVQAFASLGRFGKCRKNIERDLHRWLRNLHGTQLEPYFVKLWLDSDDDIGLVEESVATFTIFDMFRAIWKSGDNKNQKITRKRTYTT